MYLRYEPVDVVLLDYQLSDTDGMDSMETISDWDDWSLRSDVRPGIRRVPAMRTTHSRPAQARGARGIVAKYQMARELIPAVRAVAEGCYWVRGQASSPAATAEAAASTRATRLENRARFDVDSLPPPMVLIYERT